MICCLRFTTKTYLDALLHGESRDRKSKSSKNKKLHGQNISRKLWWIEVLTSPSHEDKVSCCFLHELRTRLDSPVQLSTNLQRNQGCQTQKKIMSLGIGRNINLNNLGKQVLKAGKLLVSNLKADRGRIPWDGCESFLQPIGLGILSYWSLTIIICCMDKLLHVTPKKNSICLTDGQTHK